MADITITIDNDDLDDVIDALAEAYGYDPSGGVTKVQFVKGWMRDFLKAKVKEWRIREELEATPPSSVAPTITVTGIILALILSGMALYFSMSPSATFITITPDTSQE